MDNHLLLAFISAAFLLTVTPGVDTAIVLRAATVDGRRQALMASLGIAMGCLIWGPRYRLGLARCCAHPRWRIPSSSSPAPSIWSGWGPGCCSIHERHSNR